MRPKPYTTGDSFADYEHKDCFCAVARASVEKTLVYCWRCPDCRSPNTTRRPWPTHRVKVIPTCYLEARCGKCHGRLRRLVDSQYVAFADPRTF